MRVQGKTVRPVPCFFRGPGDLLGFGQKIVIPANGQDKSQPGHEAQGNFLVHSSSFILEFLVATRKEKFKSLV
jgi:hypothetical protein